MAQHKQASYVETTKTDTDADGVFDSIYTETHLYDFKGRLLSESSAYKSTLDDTGSYSISYYEYGKKGKGSVATEFRYHDVDADGTPDSNAIINYRYDNKGKIIEEIIQSPDWSGDGKPDYKTVIDYTYNAYNNLTNAYTSYYYDEELSPYEYRSEDYKYDNEGRLLEFVIDDPIFYDFIVSWTYEYDEEGRLSSVTHHDEFDFGPDGHMVIARYTYDENDNLATETRYGEYYNNTYNAKLEYNYSYDDNGVLLSTVLEVYRESDGPLTGLTVSEYQYDERGNLKQLLNSRDLDGDRSYDIQDLYRYFHNESGTLISEIHDYGNDDIIDHEYTRYNFDQNFLLSSSPLLA